MMMLAATVVRQYLAAAFLIVIGLIASGCGDTASVNPSAELAGLTVTPGTLVPGFSGGTTQYNVNLSNNVTSVTITAQPPAGGTVTINGQATTTSAITLGAAGTPTPVSIVVSESGINPSTYTVFLNRASLAGNNSLQNLTVSPGTLAPLFSADTTDYTVNLSASLPSNVTSVTVMPTLQATTASMTVNGQAATSGQAQTAPLPAFGSNTFVNIVVTAQNGTQKTYSVNFIRAALGGDNNLSALTVQVGTAVQTLSPTFPSNTTNYTVNVGSDVTSINVSATKDDPNAVMSDDVTAAAGTATGQATIQLGVPGTTTPVLINVTAPNGSSKTYRINVIKAPLGSNNNLSALSVNVGTAAQTLSPTFDPSTTAYTVNVTSNVTEVTVSATKDDPNAVMAIGSVTVSAGTALGQASILLTGPSTSVSIMVTAQNGVNAQTYNISVNQGPSAPASAPDLIPQDDSGFLPGQDADNITNVNTPRFRIPQPGAGETPSLYVDGGKVESLFNSETNTLRPTAALSDGQHTITSTVANGGGESSPSPPLTVTIDTIAPEFP
ncbi:MAG TPA: cadherin-like beta sandwich domain-containing protein [Nitrospira sp.]|nr:cadherin-like beta sandwich domain-containing protein [Nitrospira sp.]